MSEVFDLIRMLCEDLKRHGYNVATERRHPCGYPVFHTQGAGTSKPDIFF